jgi:hypothetical protein
LMTKTQKFAIHGLSLSLSLSLQEIFYTWTLSLL